MSLKSLMRQDVILYTAGIKNRYGRESGGVESAHKARVDLKTTTRMDPQGNLVTMAGKVFLGPDVSVHQGQRMTFDGQDYEINHTYPVPGRGGKVHHVEVDIVEYQG